MTRKVKVLFLTALFLFVGFFLWSLWNPERIAWQDWQEKYFQAQIGELSGQLAQTGNPTKKEELSQKISELMQRKPSIINLQLPNGQIERCQTCHLGIEEISPSHTLESVGCTVCHGGNPLSLDQETAHAGMYGSGHPGRLDVSRLSCGGSNSECHTGHSNPLDNQVDLVAQSLMASKGSELSMARYMQGLDKSPRILVTQGHTAEQLPAPLSGGKLEKNFQQNCLTQCHLSQGQLVDQASKANGCETCHVLTDWTHTYQGKDITIPRNEVGHGLTHQITTQIPYTQCNQCHNQGMPDLFKMEFSSRSDLKAVKGTSHADLENLEIRKQTVYQPGFVYTQCEVELDCIDCHSRQEVMGDGHTYASEYDALKVQCRDCHGTKSDLPAPYTVNSPEDLAFQQTRINPVFPSLKLGSEILLTSKKEELPYVREEQGKWFLYRKLNGKKYEIPLVINSACEQKPDQQSSNDCHKCHDVSGNLTKNQEKAKE